MECNESHGALSTLLLKSPSCSLFSSFEARFIHTRASGLILQWQFPILLQVCLPLRFEVWQVKPLPTALDIYLLQYRRLSAPMLLIPMLQILTLRPPCIPSSPSHASVGPKLLLTRRPLPPHRASSGLPVIHLSVRSLSSHRLHRTSPPSPNGRQLNPLETLICRLRLLQNFLPSLFPRYSVVLSDQVHACVQQLEKDVPGRKFIVSSPFHLPSPSVLRLD